MPERTFDYIPRLVEANRAFRVAVPESPSIMNQVSRFWVPGREVLDQGREGACVGFGCTAEAMASPARMRPHLLDTGLPVSGAATRIAQGVYRAAQRIDEWEGESYEGTSVRAGMLVGREKGWWSGFRWAFTMAELRAALEEGPVVVGVEWREGMYEAPRGELEVAGRAVGGHCILVTGYSPYHRRRGWAEYRPSYRLRNSWGKSWGISGSAYISDTDLNSILFAAGGEAAVPVGRVA
jgi:hypothetical protein